MKYKLNERSKRFLIKLKTEGLFDKFLDSIQNTLEKNRDKDIAKIAKKRTKAQQDLIKSIKKDPEKAFDAMLKDFGY